MRRSENFLPPTHTHNRRKKQMTMGWWWRRRRRQRKNLTTCHVSKDLHVIVVSPLLFLLLLLLLLLQGKQLKFIMLCLLVGWGAKLWLPNLLVRLLLLPLLLHPLGSPFGAYNCHDNSLCLSLLPLIRCHNHVPLPLLLLWHTQFPHAFSG